MFVKENPDRKKKQTKKQQQQQQQNPALYTLTYLISLTNVKLSLMHKNTSPSMIKVHKDI